MHFLRTPLLALFLTVAGITVPVTLQAHPVRETHRTLHTPPPGSAERKGILDAMRLKIKELHELDVVFAVRTMRVSGSWAWVHVLPRSKDGRASYEDFYALLRNVNGRWLIAEIPCTEPDNPDCIDTPGYFRRLARRFPGLPACILPEEASVR